MNLLSTHIENEYLSFIKDRNFPCIGARAAAHSQQAKCLVVDHMACPASDSTILSFLYSFIDDYRQSARLFHSAAVLFREPAVISEEQFEGLLWQRLQALADLDAVHYKYDHRVANDPASPHFSFSLKEEACFVIGLHPASSRAARRFGFPTLVFNPHQQFEELRRNNKFEPMKQVVRDRDRSYSGSTNPMLDDFGRASETKQYSGRAHDDQWRCPLHINHKKNEHYSTPQWRGSDTGKRSAAEDSGY